MNSGRECALQRTAPEVVRKTQSPARTNAHEPTNPHRPSFSPAAASASASAHAYHLCRRARGPIPCSTPSRARDAVAGTARWQSRSRAAVVFHHTRFCHGDLRPGRLFVEPWNCSDQLEMVAGMLQYHLDVTDLSRRTHRAEPAPLTPRPRSTSKTNTTCHSTFPHGPFLAGCEAAFINTRTTRSSPPDSSVPPSLSKKFILAASEA